MSFTEVHGEGFWPSTPIRTAIAGIGLVADLYTPPEAKGPLPTVSFWGIGGRPRQSLRLGSLAAGRAWLRRVAGVLSVVKAALLDRHITAGANVVQELDRRGKHISSAMWYYYPETDEWRLLLASPDFRPGHRTESYTELFQILNSMGASADALSIDDVMVVATNDRMVPVLQNIVHASGLNTIRMQVNKFDPYYVEDVLIYMNE